MTPGVADVPGAIDERILSTDEIERHAVAEIARANRYSFPDFGRQCGGRADEHGHRMAGGERPAHHMATKGSGRSEDHEVGHVCALCNGAATG